MESKMGIVEDLLQETVTFRHPLRQTYHEFLDKIVGYVAGKGDSPPRSDVDGGLRRFNVYSLC